MQLTLYTDYALRVLLYLGLHPDRRCRIREIADAYGISRNHLVKVVRELTRGGWVEAVRGQGGGLKLARPPDRIVIGEVVRSTEPGLELLECFDDERNTCPINGACRLKQVIGRAKRRFMDELDACTLADVLAPQRRMLEIFDRRLKPAGSQRREKSPPVAD